MRSASLRSVVVFAACIFLLMKPWTDGRGLFRKKIQAFRLSPELFASSTVVFLTLDPKGVPKALLHNLKHNRVLHERTIILSVQTRDEPYVDEPYVDEPSRIEIVGHEQGIWHVILHFGYSETPDLPAAIAGLSIPVFETIDSRITYFLGRDAIVVGRESGGMMRWRRRLFNFMFNTTVNPRPISSAFLRTAWWRSAPRRRCSRGPGRSALLRLGADRSRTQLAIGGGSQAQRHLHAGAEI